MGEKWSNAHELLFDGMQGTVGEMVGDSAIIWGEMDDETREMFDYTGGITATDESGMVWHYSVFPDGSMVAFIEG